MLVMMKRNLKTLPFHKTWDRNLHSFHDKDTRHLEKNKTTSKHPDLLGLAKLQLSPPLQAYSGPQPTPAEDHTRWPMCRALGGL